MNASLPPILANGWNHVEHMVRFLLAAGGFGLVLTIVLAVRPATRRWAWWVGLLVLIVCIGVVLDLLARL